MTTVGRNDPCPCGSGRKFKHCCLRVQGVEDNLRVRLRSAEGALVPALFSYATHEFGREFFDEAWDEFFLWNDVPDDIESSKEFGTTFDPFFVFDFVPDAAEDPLPDGWPTEPLALHFLHHEVESAPELHREFIEQACKSPASFFVVEAVFAGRALDIKDILTGRRFHVLEQNASRTLRLGDVLFTRVVTAGGGSIMIGACPWVIPASWHIPLIDTRERLRPKRLLTREELLDYDLEIRQAYHEIVDALLHPTLPVLQNTDGDPLELTTLTYEIGVTVTEAVERLTPLATLRGDVHLADEVRDAAGALMTATLTWIKAGNRKNKDWDNTTLGTLRLDGSRLVVEVNSARRRRRIEKEIAKCSDRRRRWLTRRSPTWPRLSSAGAKRVHLRHRTSRPRPIRHGRPNSKRSRPSSHASTGTPGSTPRCRRLATERRGKLPRPRPVVSGSKPCWPTTPRRVSAVVTRSSRTSTP